MKINSVKKYKGSTYETELDDGRKFYLHADIIADFGIRSGYELDSPELKKIIYASNFRRAFQYALYLLDYRDYSYRDMFRKLEATYKNEKLCYRVMEKLVSIGVINDVRYAEKLARKFVESKRFGPYRARREMMEKGLGADTADAALCQYEDAWDENIRYLLEGKHSRLLTDRYDRKSIEKVKNALIRYGYGFDEINRGIKDYFEDYDDDYIQEDE